MVGVRLVQSPGQDRVWRQTVWSMASPHLRHAVNVTLAGLAVLALAAPAARPAGVAVGSAAAVVMLAPVRRDPAGGPADPTSPWPGAAGVPSGLVPLAPGVRLRMPVALAARRQPHPTSSRLPRGAVRAIALVLIALGGAIVVVHTQMTYDCLNLLSLFAGSDACEWKSNLRADGVAALAALVLSVAYAANRLARQW